MSKVIVVKEYKPIGHYHSHSAATQAAQAMCVNEQVWKAVPCTQMLSWKIQRIQ